MSLVRNARRCARPLGSEIEITLIIANFGPVRATETYNTFLESSLKISKNELYCLSGTYVQNSQMAKYLQKRPKHKVLPTFILLVAPKA